MAEQEQSQRVQDTQVNADSQPPALWPNVSSDDLVVAPVFNGTFWLALIKQNTPDSLSSYQRSSLAELGFKEGSQGRLIYPKRVDQALAESLSRILNVPLDVLSPESMVFLKPGTEVRPAVPLEIQAGIRWFWKNQPQLLLTEIQTALEQRADELSKQTLQETLNNRLQNSLRLQRWVGLALSGELSAVTEPIIGLGLQKAGQSYGELSQWPGELQKWHEKLADERGDSPSEAAEISAPAALVDQLTQDHRPLIGKSVNWTLNGKADKGAVVDHDPDDKTALWVSSSSPKPLINGIHFPTRTRITLDVINGLTIPEPRKPEPKAENEVIAAPAILAPVNPDLLKPQAPLTLNDIDPSYKSLNSRGATFTADEMTALEFVYRSGNIRGNSPLLPSDGSSDMIEYWYGVTRDIMYERGLDYPAAEATVIYRDMILDDFNAAQPPSPNGERSLFAVYPMSALGARSFHNGEAFDTETLEAMRAQQFCRIGLHPDYAISVKDAILGWASVMDDQLQGKDPDLLESLSRTAAGMTKRTMFADSMTFNSVDSHSLSGLAETITRKLSLEERPTSALGRLTYIHENSDKIVERSNDSVFANYQSAGDWINGLNPKMAEIADRNDRILQSLSELTDTAPADIENTPHPMFAVIDEMHKLGLPKCSKAQAMAMLNCDISNHIDWVGQMANLNGARLPLTHATTMQLEATEEMSALLRDHSARKIDVAYTTTGWIETRSNSRPFQVSFVSNSKNIHMLADQLGGSRFVAGTGYARNFLLVQEDAGPNGALGHIRYQGLGRLIELHANHKLEFGKPFDGEIVPEETLDDVPMNIFTVSHLGEIEKPARITEHAGLTRVPMTKLTSTPTEPIGDVAPDKLVQHLRGARSALVTLTPSWRNQRDSMDKMREAIRFWVDDQKHLKALKYPEKKVASIEESLVQDPDTEILIIATKQTSRAVHNSEFRVSRDDIIAANNDRALAIEQGVLTMKASDQSLVSGWKFAAFDAATVMRPQALRTLNERRELLRRQIRGEGVDAPEAKTTRGKRQDKGVVAGLSIKDLRGKTSTVLSNLRYASHDDQGRHVTKVKLWDAPDWTMLRQPDEEAMNEGERAMEPIVAAFFDYARKQLPSQPPANIPGVNQAYAELTLVLRDSMEEIRTSAELKDALAEPDGEIHLAINRIAKFCDDNSIPARLMIGSDGLSRGWNSSSYGTIWHQRADRKSKGNTYWSVDTNSGKTFRRATVKDETGAMPMLQALIRKGGEDYRGETDIDEQTMLTTFGFSGVEYGKSMTQSDRTEYLNHAYDGFMDMSKVLNVPPKALSLGGTLGLAFGSRGRGGRNAALAHFEPTNNVINLTRMKGAGSMAHEYGHALANYFYRLSKGTPGDRNGGDITETISHQLARNVREPKISAGNLRNPVAEAIAVVMQSIRYNLPPKAGEEGYSLSESSKAITGEIASAQSPMAMGAKSADRARNKPYWCTPEELFARSFETWTHEALKKDDPSFQNDFLVRKDKLETWATPLDDHETPSYAKKASLYPSGDQLKSIDQAFRKLFNTVQHKEIEINHDHLGKISLPILYSHDTGAIEVLSRREHEIVAECVMTEVARMCGEHVWVQWQAQINDGSGNEAAGRYRDLPSGREDAEHKVRGVIDLAYGTSMGTAYHEAFHFAQSALMTETEQTMLDRSFSVGSPLHARLCDTLQRENKSHLIEHCEQPREAQAYAYELWVKGKLKMDIQEHPTSLFGRVKRFLSKITEMGEQSGFQSADQLFRAFYSGKLAERASKTQELKDIDKVSEMTGGASNFDTSLQSRIEASTPRANDTSLEVHGYEMPGLR